MPDRPFHRFLTRSLGAMEKELPTGYAAVCDALGPCDVAIFVDGEDVMLRGDGARLFTDGDGTRAPRVVVRLGRAAIRELLAGTSTLLEELLRGTVEMRGHADDLVPFHDALISYVASAARCPSFPRLLDDFLETA